MFRITHALFWAVCGVTCGCTAPERHVPDTQLDDGCEYVATFSKWEKLLVVPIRMPVGERLLADMYFGIVIEDVAVDGKNVEPRICRVDDLRPGPREVTPQGPYFYMMLSSPMHSDDRQWVLSSRLQDPYDSDKYAQFSIPRHAREIDIGYRVVLADGRVMPRQVVHLRQVYYRYL